MEAAFYAVVIGSGQAGPFLAARLAGAGMKTALIEREHWGGTCVNDGCMPTKTRSPAPVPRTSLRAGIATDARGFIRVDERAY
jgi:flavin-dependent dehydrogenase